jgi:hypothetical protein
MPGEENVFVVTGDSGQGMTHGTIAGILLTDLIQGRSNEWAKLYDPGRLTSIATIDFLNESLTVAAHYTDWLSRGEVGSTKEIERDEGRNRASRPDEDRSLSRRSRGASRATGDLHASWMCRLLELNRTKLGLSVSRLTLRQAGPCDQRTSKQ